MSDGELLLRVIAALALALTILALASYSPFRPRPKNPSERMIDPWSKRS